MEKRIKKRLLISALIGTLGQLTLLFYIADKHPLLMNWRFIASILLLLFGILLTFNLIPLRKTVFKEKKLIYYAVIVNPGFVSIFTGITGLTIQNPQLEYIGFFSGIIMVFSIIIGFVILIAALIKNVA